MESSLTSPVSLLSVQEYSSRFIDPFFEVIRKRLLQDRPLDVMQYVSLCLADHRAEQLHADIKDAGICRAIPAV